MVEYFQMITLTWMNNGWPKDSLMANIAEGIYPNDGVLKNAFVDTGGKEIVFMGTKNMVTIEIPMNGSGQELLHRK